LVLRVVREASTSHCSSNRQFSKSRLPVCFYWHRYGASATLGSLPSRLSPVACTFSNSLVFSYSSLEWPRSHYISQFSITVLVVLQLTLLVLWSTRACERTTTSTVAAVLALVIAMVLIPLSHTEHSRSVRPSTLICVYLVASMGFDAVQVRTLFLTGVDIVIPATLCASIATKLIITMVEASEKRAYLRQPFCSYPPETIANTFNRTFLWWLNRTFLTGFRKLMTHDDLDSTSSELRSRMLAQRLKTSWRSRCTNRSHSVPPSRWMLPLASFSCFRSEVISVIPARLFLIGFNYAQPFLFARAIKLLAEPSDQITENYGYGLIAATGIIYVGIAVSSRTPFESIRANILQVGYSPVPAEYV
jgi:ATP-binding cassette subfamily C (CFTR/MRP) protein 1